MGFSIPRLADQALLARRYGREPAIVARPCGYRGIYSRARIPLRPGRARPAHTGWLRREVARTRTASDALAAGHTGEHRNCSAGLAPRLPYGLVHPARFPVIGATDFLEITGSMLARSLRRTALRTRRREGDT